MALQSNCRFAINAKASPKILTILDNTIKGMIVCGDLEIHFDMSIKYCLAFGHNCEILSKIPSGDYKYIPISIRIFVESDFSLETDISKIHLNCYLTGNDGVIRPEFPVTIGIPITIFAYNPYRETSIDLLDYLYSVDTNQWSACSKLTNYLTYNWSGSVYVRNGLFHNLKGPAIILSARYEDYAIDGCFYDKNDYYNHGVSNIIDTLDMSLLL